MDISIRRDRYLLLEIMTIDASKYFWPWQKMKIIRACALAIKMGVIVHIVNDKKFKIKKGILHYYGSNVAIGTFYDRPNKLPFRRYHCYTHHNEKNYCISYYACDESEDEFYFYDRRKTRPLQVIIKTIL